ncbi:MAG: hypothetical protein ABEJ60_05095 [Halodesulfurarchaeum sp.]
MDDDSSSELEGPRGDDLAAASTLMVSHDEAFVNDQIRVKGFNLPANQTVSVSWRLITGMWGMQRSNKVLGPQYTSQEEELFRVETDESREFKRSWTVPESFGGEHHLELKAGDRTLDTESFTIKPHFELDRQEAPLGESFRLRGYGLGRDRVSTNYQVTWDNGYVGFMTGVENRGTATADIRAVGPVGEHVIQVWRNYTGVPFLQNNTQSPADEITGGRPYVWNVTVTEPDRSPPLAEMESMYDEEPIQEHIPPVDEESEASLTIQPTSGKPGTSAILTGRGFPANTEVDLVWHTHGGERVSDDPVRSEPRPEVLPTTVTDEEGSFQVDITIPTDIGATRPIFAAVDGRTIASTGFMLQPDIVDVSPTKGPVGTAITVELAGLGWPLYENNYYVLYDNKPMGYVASNVAEDGIVRFNVRASGEPGYHFIEVIPTFNNTETDEFDFDHKPHLSYLDNHPGRAMPGMHFAIEVTE